MGWETKGKPVLEDGAFGEEFVAYVNAYWIDGEVIGGVYDTEEEACAEAGRARRGTRGCLRTCAPSRTPPR